MKTFVPHYYSDFKCTAGECRHSCCEHWEIDIDPATLQKYNSLNTEFGEEIRKNICFADGCYSFRLSEGERCPFLNADNLCDIILTLGEGALCDVCTDHPRFRNFHSDRVEMGLGLCCEEACRIILADDRPFSVVPLDGEDFDLEENSFLHSRDMLLRAFGSPNNVDVFSAVESTFNFDEISAYELYSKLEMLDTEWQCRLELLKSPAVAKPSETAHKMFRNLYKYFIFRYFTPEFSYEGLAFSEISVKIIWAICQRSGFTPQNICEVARMYSSEIEYSDENVEKIIDYVMNLSEV